ncbi:hypothetical protein Ancab_034109 [Ancistrocladus abbreviatus]
MRAPDTEAEDRDCSPLEHSIAPGFTGLHLSGHLALAISSNQILEFLLKIGVETEADTEEKLEEYGKEISALKEEVRAKLVDNSITDHVEKMKLIDAVERLGASYHYKKEIEGLVQQIFEAYAKNNFEGDDDLHTTALLFRVFRQHGYKMPCGKLFI